MTKRSVLWLLAGVVLWACAFWVSWMLRDAPDASAIAGGLMGGTAGLMVGRAVVFPRLGGATDR